MYIRNFVLEPSFATPSHKYTGYAILDGRCIGNFTLKNCSIVNNKALSGDGIDQMANVDSYILHCNFINVDNCIFKSNHGDYGGPITASGDVVVSNSIFEDNHNSGTCCSSGGAINTKGSATLVNVVFSKNHALVDGGAIYAKTVTFVDTLCLFVGNAACYGKGGAIYTDKFTNDVKYAVFISNAASMIHSDDDSDDGGAIYVNSENHITFSYCIFINNHCSDEGGAIYFDSCKSHVTLHDNIFMNNGAKDEGQDIFNKGYYGVIKNNYWSKNPTKSNDQLVEWKFNPFVKNACHSDSSPLKLFSYADMSGVLKKNEFRINEFVSYVFRFIFKLECDLFH